MANLRFLLKVPSIVLANLVIGKNVYPEYLQEACTAENLADAIEPLLSDTAMRAPAATRRTGPGPAKAAPRRLKSERGGGPALRAFGCRGDQAAGKSRRGGPM